MRFLSIRTKKFLPPKDNVIEELGKCLPKLKEGDVLFITSKILAIHQGRCVKKLKSKNQKSKLIRQEANFVLPPHTLAGHKFILTIKDSTLIPSAGIDESNGNGYYILWPKNTNALLKQIYLYLKKKHKIKNLAIIATDSHTTPLRRGVTGISTGFFGLEPLIDLRGKKDIFNRALKVTQVNIVDAISAMAVFFMGEGKEQTPIILMRGLKNIKFANTQTSQKLLINAKEDLYYPLLKVFSAKGGSLPARRAGASGRKK